ncbi:MAG: hypothetical protein JEZ06_14485 [Anaerolineaceae bacterium]|nr:hypothetical protein [Anaerolineaceae bacterium]
MQKMSISDRVLLFLTALLASFQVMGGIEGLGVKAISSYTVGFGALLLAAILMAIMGFEVLESPFVVIVSTVIPLSIAMGLVSSYFPLLEIPFLIFTILGLIAVISTRFYWKKLATFSIILVHGIAGLIIFILPISLSLSKVAPLSFTIVGVGGGLIGIGGVLLSFLKVGKPLLSAEKVHGVLPGLLFIVTLLFVIGFMFV